MRDCVMMFLDQVHFTRASSVSLVLVVATVSSAEIPLSSSVL